MAKGGAREGSGRKGFKDRRTLYASIDGRHMSALDAYKKRHKLRSRSEAVRRLIERAEAADKGAAKRLQNARNRQAWPE